MLRLRSTLLYDKNTADSTNDIQAAVA